MDKEPGSGKQKKFIKEIMTTGVISIDANDSIQKAIDIMTERNISCIIVTEGDDHKPKGIITERDLVQRVLRLGKDRKKTKAKDIMTTSLVTISEDASLGEGMRIIQNMHIRRIPVVGEHGLTGLVTQTDIVKETYNIHMHNKRLTFHQNIQSYIILALIGIVVIAALVRFIIA